MAEEFYTNFPEEEEILLDDGMPFLIEKISKDELKKIIEESGLLESD